MAVLRDDSSVAVRLIVALGARPDELFGDIAKAVGAPTAQTTAGGERLGKAPAAKGGGKTPTLDQFGRDLTKQAKEGRLDPVIGRAAAVSYTHLDVYKRQGRWSLLRLFDFVDFRRHFYSTNFCLNCQRIICGKNVRVAEMWHIATQFQY